MEKRTLIANSLSLLITRLIQSVATFVLSAAIARNLGAYELGQYLLAFSFYFVFATIVSQGLKTLFTRELARNPQEMPIYLVNGICLQILLSILGYIAMVILVFVLPYKPDTTMVCYIMGLAIIPFSLSNITEAIFQAQEKMIFIAGSTVPVYILRLVAMIWVMQELNYGVNYVAGVFVISELVIFVIQWLLLTRTVKPQWMIRKDFILQLLKSAKTFFAIDAVGIVSSKLGVLIISLLGNETMVGLYGAIIQLIQPVAMVVNSVSLAAFPGMTKAVSVGKHKQREVTENILAMLLCIALPFIIGVWFVGQDLLLFIYQDAKFAEIDLVFKLRTLALANFTLVRTLNYVLLSNGLERYNLREVVITNVVSTCVGVIFISQFQIIGAAFMDITTALTASTILMYVTYTRIFALNLWRVIYRPLILSIGMICVFVTLSNFNLNFLSVLLIVSCAYALFGSYMLIHTFGGIRSVSAKFFNKSTGKV